MTARRLALHFQPRPEGLAQAFVIGKHFIGSDRAALVLGDNIFYGHGFQAALEAAATHESGATIFAYPVRDPERFGVIEFDEHGRAISLEEKPRSPRSHFAVPGIYFYDNEVVELATGLRPSPRGELEITDLNRIYLERGRLRVEELGRGFAWLDTGTPDSLLQASAFVQTIQERQGLKIACLEEIAFHLGYLTADELTSAGMRMKSDYGKYLIQIATEVAAGERQNHGLETTVYRGDRSEWTTRQRTLPSFGARRRSAA